MKFVKFYDHQGYAAIDFAACEEHAKTLSVEQLIYVIADAGKAARAADDMIRGGYVAHAGYYWDEVHTYSAELRKRQEKARKGADSLHFPLI